MLYYYDFYIVLFWLYPKRARKKELPIWTDMNKTHAVREIHIAIQQGQQYYLIYYYDGDEIKTLSTQRWYDDNMNYRGVEAIFHRSNQSKSYMVWVKQYNYPGFTYDGKQHPDSIYDVYVSDNMSFTGDKTSWEEEHSIGKSHYTTTESAEVQ